MSRYFGLKDAKPATRAARRALDAQTFEKLKQFVPLRPAGFIPEPMSPEEFKAKYGGQPQ